MIRLPSASALVLALGLALAAVPAAAQQPAPRVGPFVVDLQGALPQFPSESQALADSRGLALSQLPGLGVGVHVGAHVYPIRWKAITFGIGGELMTARSGATPLAPGPDQPPPPPTRARLTTYSPQLSFNFGGQNGWSYISAGLGATTWSIVPDGAAPQPPDEARLKTLSYGGGARWFAKRRIGISFDVRFYAINPGQVYDTLPQSPRTTLLTISAGLSIR